MSLVYNWKDAKGYIGKTVWCFDSFHEFETGGEVMEAVLKDVQDADYPFSCVLKGEERETWWRFISDEAPTLRYNVGDVLVRGRTKAMITRVRDGEVYIEDEWCSPARLKELGYEDKEAN